MNLQTRAFRSFRGSGGDGNFIGSASSSSSGHLPSHQHQQQQHVVPHHQQPLSHPSNPQQQPHQQQQPLSVEERNQVIFRKVRGILNKLTPEKFDKLGDQLISLGLDSVPVLKGVILLIFEKAIEEPKYSSMYAQLCKKLSRELSNFENNCTPPPPATTASTTTTSGSSSLSNESNTFCRLLLIKCRDEFDNRLKATEKFRDKLTTGNNNGFGNQAASRVNYSGTHSNNSNNHKGNGPPAHRPVLTNLSSLSSGNNSRRMVGQGTANQGLGSGSSSAGSAIASAPRKLSDEEEEQWTIAKSKMLGNIRFICELGRQGLVQENILHVCIKQLVSKRKEETIGSKSEDLECLCQIMKTVGRLLDTEKARKLMDQYFERIIFYSGCQELPSRIRFMLKDVIELREGRWQPRRVQRENGPRPIGQIREEAAKDLGIDAMCFWDTASMLQNMSARSVASYMNGAIVGIPGSGPSPTGYGQQQRLPLYGHPALPLVMNPGQRALDDMGYYAFGSNSFLGTGPGAIREDRHGSGGGGGGGGNQRRNQSQSQEGMQNHGGNRQHGTSNPGTHVQGHMPYRGSSSQDDPRKRMQDQQQQQQSGTGGGRNNPSGNQNRNGNQSGMLNNLPPRMLAVGQKNPVYPQQSGPPVNQMNTMPIGGPGARTILQTPVPKMPPIENISLRPAQNSMVLKPTLGVAANMGPNQRPAGMGVSGKSSPVPDQSGKMANGKAAAAAAGPTVNPKEVLLKRCSDIMENLVTESISLKESMAKMRELKIPKNFQSDVLMTLMKSSLTRSDKEREQVMRLLNSMKNENLLSPPVFHKSCDQLLGEISKLEVDDPLIKTHLSEFLGTFVSNKILTLKEAYNLVVDRYPMFLLVLQRMNSIVGKQSLCSLLEGSRINLMSILPEGDRNKEQLIDILEKRGLSFLQPLLRVELDMRKLLSARENSNPALVSKWIKENVDDSLVNTKGFIFLLYTGICRHIMKQAVDQNRNNTDGKSIADREKEMIKNFRSILTTYTANKASLQLTALYALQSVCHKAGFPKGMILRWFNNLYDLEIIDEEVFLEWKEDLNDEFPGKGQALFQVNTWLIWLAETEGDSEDEDEDEDDDEADSLSRK